MTCQETGHHLSRHLDLVGSFYPVFFSVWFPILDILVHIKLFVLAISIGYLTIIVVYTDNCQKGFRIDCSLKIKRTLIFEVRLQCS